MKEHRIAAVVFDLDDTLYDERVYLEAVLEQAQEDLALDLEAARRAVQTLAPAGQADILGVILGEQRLNTRRNHEILFQHYRSLKRSIQLPEESAHVLAWLRGMGISVGVLTNGDVAAQLSKVNALRLEKRVDAVIYARALGRRFEKPDASAFWRSLNALGVRPERALFVGDNPKTDIAGASAVGMITVLLSQKQSSSNSTLGDVQIKRLAALVEDFARHGIIWDGGP